MKRLAFFGFFIALLVSFNTFATTSHHTSQHKATSVQSQEDTVTLHFFWSKDCPHCVAAHPFIDKLKAEYPWLRVKQYEVSASQQNSQLFEKMARDRGREISFVPTFFVGDKMIVGYTSPTTTGAEIRNAVLEAHKK